ncbi:MAG TPA: sigma factor [Sphingopyxis sp.]|uniref:sigma factor n=1 Tax=Sphingopyxis sp. TaxID=1908224 RepID=UPI002C7A504A|nr:sigma factor [Sphingopyxis sp.]HWW56021.1 sigma factor [Sphingopyxis sp.]
MSAKSDALEMAVTEYIQARTALDAAPGQRTRAQADRSFMRLAALAAPRIRYFTRSYGLTDVAEDAAQVCAIALHRAAERYDPARARFTTYVNWQFRAELQALRHRLHGDQRCAGRRHVTATLSLDALQEDGTGDWLVDPAAESATEQRAADNLAELMAARLVGDWAARRRAGLRRTRGGDDRIEIRVAAEQALVRDHLLVTEVAERLRESERHVVRRALADIVRHAASRKLH